MLSDISLIGHNVIVTHVKGNKYRNNLMTCSVSCVQQSVEQTGVFIFLLHPGFFSITCYLPLGPVGCKTTERGIERQDRRTEMLKGIQYFQGRFMYVSKQMVSLYSEQ